MLTDDELLRYSRHILLEDFDVEKQLRLKQSHALIIGAGGLGCPAALYLASSGIGRLTLVDDDQVELSNLQRQIAHGTADIGRSKVHSLAEQIAAINPDCVCHCIDKRLDESELAETLSLVDIVLDCSDNFSTRFLLNRLSVESQTPLVSAAAIRSEAQLTVFDPRQADSPCYQCLYQPQQDDQLNCSDSGVLAPLVGMIGSWQALEAIKVLTGYGESLYGKLLVFDLKYNQCRTLRLQPDPDCPICASGKKP